MAASSNTTWSKGFSENPYGLARGDVGLAEMVRQVAGEWLVYPAGNDGDLHMSRQEALVRTLWTRAVIDGDMTAIKLLVELLEGKGAGTGEAGGAVLTADDLARAEAALLAWADEHLLPETGTAAGDDQPAQEGRDDGR